MYNVTLLSSFHRIHGKCNPGELYKIIDKIHPEVIFEELSQATFIEIYNGLYPPISLEAITIKEYLIENQILHFPVDTYPINEADIFNGTNAIAGKSGEYVQLYQQHANLIAQHGYSFINSEDCAKLLGSLKVIERLVLSELNDSRLLSEHQREKELDEKRENQMIQNIYNYSKKYKYSQALFICGAEHRNPIKEKLKKFKEKEEIELNWMFYGE